MSDESQAIDNIHEALKAAVALKTPGGLVVGWSVLVEYLDPESDDDGSRCTTFTAAGQLMSTTIGQHIMATTYHKADLLE